MSEETQGKLSHEQLKLLRDQIKQRGQERYLEQSKRRLDKILTQKLRTTFIGALDSFEKAFGFLWGHGKPESELSKEEQEFRTLWVNARTEILNKGNNQLRAIRTELNNHVISWNRYHMDLPVKPLSEDMNNG